MYIAALLGGIYHVAYAFCAMRKSGKEKKEIK
jgi:hypothetical protein